MMGQIYDDFDEDDEPLVDVTPLLDSFVQDTEGLAKYYIDRFFQGKEMHYGGAIPRLHLHCRHYVDMVLDMDICRGVSLAYMLLKGSDQEDIDCDGEEDGENDDDLSVIPPDVKAVVNILEECSKMMIPKEFASGITLMYLELCCGKQLPRSALSKIMGK